MSTTDDLFRTCDDCGHRDWANEFSDICSFCGADLCEFCAPEHECGAMKAFQSQYAYEHEARCEYDD
jgi:hypothetical protein